VSKIIVDTIESTGTTVTVNDSLDAGTNTVTAGTVTGITAASITSGTFPATTTFAGSISATASFAGAGVAAKIYSKDQSTSTYSNNSTSFLTSGMGFFHTFSSTKTYVVHAVMNRIFCDCNANEFHSFTHVEIKRDTGSTSIPSSGSSTVPGTAVYNASFGQSGPNTSTLNHDVHYSGNDLRIGPFTGTGTTDVYYAVLRTENTNVTATLFGIRWVVEEYDVAPTTMS
tara:strand:- start:3947 stop:4630 length:684 start_codon:yes stop_codon:yes gene_type:complete